MIKYTSIIDNRDNIIPKLFCPYIWVIVLLYQFNYIKFSPLYLTFFAYLFTISHTTILKKKITNFQMMFLLYIEFFIFLLVTRKHFLIDKKKLIIINDIFISLIIFFTYLLFLKLITNKSFYEIYFLTYYK